MRNNVASIAHYITVAKVLGHGMGIVTSKFIPYFEVGDIQYD